MGQNKVGIFFSLFLALFPLFLRGDFLLGGVAIGITSQWVGFLGNEWVGLDSVV
jgi:hypothetical protein